MREHPQRNGQKTQPMSAALVADSARSMLEQLSFPIDPRDTIKARRERAIRRAGISPAKGMRLWYGQACSLLAHEYLQIKEAYRAHVERQEARLAEELEFLRTLQARERQHDIRFAHEPASPGGVASSRNVVANAAAVKATGETA